MSLDEGTSNLIKRIYSARHRPDEWDSVAQAVLAAVGGRAGLSTLVDLGQRQYDTCRFYGPDDSDFAAGVQEYAQGLYKKDPSLAWASRNPDARFCDSRVAVAAADGAGAYLDDPFVQWNRARFKSTHWFVGYTPADEGLSYSFSVLFPAEQGPGDPQSLKLFRLLFDHMESAMRLNRRPFNADSARPLILLDRTGQVREVSNGARLLLGRADAALRIAGGRLEAAADCEQPRLDGAIAAAADVLSSGAASVAAKLGCPGGHRPWILTVRPILYEYGPFRKVLTDILVQVHAGQAPVQSLQLLQSLFGLTARELQLVRLLADGHSVESLAECMEISPNTARTHLRAIFAKTETNRQSDLIQLCASLAAG